MTMHIDGLDWLEVANPEVYAADVLLKEASDIPASRRQGQWVAVVLDVSDLSVNEDMVRDHDDDPGHCERRDGFLRAVEQRAWPPMIALGPKLHLVDGYARLRALRVMGVEHCLCLVQVSERGADGPTTEDTDSQFPGRER